MPSGPQVFNRTEFDFPQRTRGRLALVDVAVVPMSSERLDRAQTVLVEDGRIRLVGPSNEVSVEGATVLDCSGKYLMPGLADMHVHLWEPADITMYLVNGVTTVRNMWGAPLHLALREKVRRGQVPGPQIHTASPIVDGVDRRGRTIWPGSVALAEPGAAQALVDSFACAGYQQVKAYQWLRPEVLDALGAASARAGMRMTGHCPDGMGYERAMAAGMSCFEHLTGIAHGHLSTAAAVPRRGIDDVGSHEAMARLLANVDLDQIRRLADVMAAREIWNCPTLVVSRAQLRDPADAEEPLLAYEAVQTVRRWRSVVARRVPPEGPRRASYRSLMERRNATLTNIVSILSQSEAPLLLGTDARNPFVFQGFSVHEELAHLVDAGLTPYRALRCATADAARFMGESDSWGTVEQGRRADLLLVGRNPLVDIHAVSDPEAVLVNGFHLPAAALGTLREQRRQWARQVGQLSPLPRERDRHRGRRPTLDTVLIETQHGAPTARVACRHRHLADGGWLLAEQSRAAPAEHVRTAEIRLRSDFAIRTARYTVEHHQLGAEVCVITSRPDGTYQVRLRQVDGRETTTLLSGAGLVPSERLAVSFFPLLVTAGATGDRMVLEALSVDNGEPRTVAMSLSRLDASACSAPGVTAAWRLRIARPGDPVEHTISLGPGSALVEMTEDSPRARRLGPAGSLAVLGG